MSDELKGLRVAFLTANEGVEQVELTAPWQAVKDAGGTDTFGVHRSERDAEELRTVAAAVTFVQRIFETGKPAFCEHLVKVFSEQVTSA